VWGDALERWFADPETWDRDVLGPRPDEAGRQIPADIVAKGVDRDRKRRARRREAAAAQARKAEADQELRTTLLNACNGNYSASLQADTLAPVREVLKVLPLDQIVMVIKQKVDKRCFPGNPPLTTWRDPRFLRAVADNYCGGVVIPSMVAAWEAAGKAPATKAHGSSPPAGHTPDDIDELRRRHDDEHAPPGPHSLPNPSMTGKAVERPAPSDATSGACSAGKRTSGATGAA
jgi:hypothetical protein